MSLASFPNVVFETVPVTITLSRPFKDDRRPLPLSATLSSRRSMVRCPWLCARLEMFSEGARALLRNGIVAVEMGGGRRVEKSKLLFEEKK